MSDMPSSSSSAPPGWYPASEGPFERWWDGNQWAAQTRPLGSTDAQPRASRASRIAGWLMVGFGALVVLAALLPWATLGPFSVAGTEGDGAITLTLGLLVAGLGIARGVGAKAKFWQVGVPVACLVCGLLVTLVGFYDTVNVSETASAGSGLILTILGGLGLLGAALFGLIRRD